MGEGKGVYNKEVISRGGAWRIRPCVCFDFILKMPQFICMILFLAMHLIEEAA